MDVVALREPPRATRRSHGRRYAAPSDTLAHRAVSWVDMGDEATAREFHRLVDGSGTGNITELSRETRALPLRPFHGRHLRIPP
jgi:hypothetical protein